MAILHPPAPTRRTVSECLALAKAHEDETGRAPVLDADFANDVAVILSLSRRQPWTPPAWD